MPYLNCLFSLLGNLHKIKSYSAQGLCVDRQTQRDRGGERGGEAYEESHSEVKPFKSSYEPQLFASLLSLRTISTIHTLWAFLQYTHRGDNGRQNQGRRKKNCSPLKRRLDIGSMSLMKEVGCTVALSPLPLDIVCYSFWDNPGQEAHFQSGMSACAGFFPCHVCRCRSSIQEQW